MPGVDTGRGAKGLAPRRPRRRRRRVLVAVDVEEPLRDAQGERPDMRAEARCVRAFGVGVGVRGCEREKKKERVRQRQG